MAMDVLEQIDAVAKQAEVDLAKITTPAELEEFRIRYLSANGLIKQLMKLLGGVPKEQKPAVGQRVNLLSKSVTEQVEQLKERVGIGCDGADRSMLPEPGRRPAVGNKAHPDEDDR